MNKPNFTIGDIIEFTIDDYLQWKKDYRLIDVAEAFNNLLNKYGITISSSRWLKMVEEIQKVRRLLIDSMGYTIEYKEKKEQTLMNNILKALKTTYKHLEGNYGYILANGNEFTVNIKFDENGDILMSYTGSPEELEDLSPREIQEKIEDIISSNSEFDTVWSWTTFLVIDDKENPPMRWALRGFTKETLLEKVIRIPMQVDLIYQFSF